MMARDPLTAYRQWKSINRRVLDFSRNHPSHVFHQRYEDYLQNPEEKQTALRVFMALQKNQQAQGSSCRDRIPSSETTIHSRINSDGNIDRAEAWRKETPSHNIITNDLLARKELAAHGYLLLTSGASLRYLLSTGTIKAFAMSYALRVKD